MAPTTCAVLRNGQGVNSTWAGLSTWLARGQCLYLLSSPTITFSPSLQFISGHCSFQGFIPLFNLYLRTIHSDGSRLGKMWKDCHLKRYFSHFNRCVLIFYCWFNLLTFSALPHFRKTLSLTMSYVHTLQSQFQCHLLHTAPLKTSTFSMEWTSSFLKFLICFTTKINP